MEVKWQVVTSFYFDPQLTSLFYLSFFANISLFLHTFNNLSLIFYCEIFVYVLCQQHYS